VINTCIYSKDKGKCFDLIIIQSGEIIQVNVNVLNVLITRDDILRKKGKNNLNIRWSPIYNEWIMDIDKLKKYKYLVDLIENGLVLSNANFIEFLTDNNSYHIFIRNMKEYQKLTTNWTTLFSFCDEIKKKDYILTAFIWKNSKEDEGYWSDLNDKWMEYIN